MSQLRNCCLFAGPFTKEEEATILNNVHRMNSRSYPEKQLGDMWNNTKILLKDFYKSYNRKLATLLGDDRFLWND